jgi:antirestriction protein ArdC
MRGSDMQISRIRLSDKTSRLHPRHVVPKSAQAYEPEFANTAALNPEQRGSVVKRDLYAEVSARIIAELERGAAPWVKPWSATAGANTPCNAVTNRPYSGCNVVLLWMAQQAGYRTPRYLTFKQALELGGHVRRGQKATRVYFVKQLQVRGEDKDGADTRIIPMLREYYVFMDQCENLPARVMSPSNINARNRDERDGMIDQFLECTGADIR